MRNSLSDSGENAEEFLQSHLVQSAVPPLLILGGAGSGKSTLLRWSMPTLKSSRKEQSAKGKEKEVLDPIAPVSEIRIMVSFSNLYKTLRHGKYRKESEMRRDISRLSVREMFESQSSSWRGRNSSDYFPESEAPAGERNMRMGEFRHAVEENALTLLQAPNVRKVLMVDAWDEVPTEWRAAPQFQKWFKEAFCKEESWLRRGFSAVVITSRYNVESLQLVPENWVKCSILPIKKKGTG